ncbi:MAG: DNA topoisomerase IV subunit A [Magnetococcales bacterium]|nr:DNA topoisomerase IV subunit A [Magnetococcales bacterium]
MSSPVGNIKETPIRTELENRYLAYALSTIISRSLPDVRDGLKPVHRRILFAMRALHLDPGSGFKKSARVVGDVIGKFHPHGDQAAYEAMVRLAQEFAVRYPLVDGQGNFGNIDGDGAAAMRYTEARLTKVAQSLLEDLDQETVALVPTYDGSLEEPSVLPARFPNLLANGSTGIAVGMSTSIPPHNVGEILAAALLLIRKPDATVDELVSCVPGPDFPTGGVLVSDRAEILETYRTGRGTLRLRARWSVEKLQRGGWRLVISEIPYQVPKARLIERIAQLIVEKKSPFLADVRDESDERLRIVLEPKVRTIEPEKVMAYLFKNTDLEVRVTINLNVVTAEARPEVLDLKGLLRAWLDHRFQINTRRSRYELERIGQRLHLLAAFLTVHLNIDAVVAIIKEHDEPAPVLMQRFSLDEEQAEAILNLRLRSLRRLEEMDIRKEIAEKEARAGLLRALLTDDQRMWQAVQQEVQKTRKEFADPRRTELGGVPPEVDLRPEDLIQREPQSVVLSLKGWIKTLKGHDADLGKQRFKGDDELLMQINAYSNDTVTFVAGSGKIYSTLVDRLPSGKGFGDPLTVIFEIEGGDSIQWAMVVEGDKEYFVATRLGQGFRIKGSDFVANQRTGKQILSFGEDDRIHSVRPVRGSRVGSICRGRRLLVCDIDEFPLLSRGKGVRIQRLQKGEELVDVMTFSPEGGLTLDSGKRSRQFVELEKWFGPRGSRGGMLPHGFLGGAVFQGSGVSPELARKGQTGDLDLEEDA